LCAVGDTLPPPPISANLFLWGGTEKMNIFETNRAPTN
jgi:hypothetical protein